jgi:hypothetical protein
MTGHHRRHHREAGPTRRRRETFAELVRTFLEGFVGLPTT